MMILVASKSPQGAPEPFLMLTVIQTQMQILLADPFLVDFLLSNARSHTIECALQRVLGDFREPGRQSF
jgi:hypothetical protein